MVRVTALTRAVLAITAGGLILGALALILLPDYDTTGPSLEVIFRIASRTGADPRDLWGALFLAAGLIAAAGARYGIRHPQLERVALLAVLGGETAWALGLSAPLFLHHHRANALAVIAWLMLAVTTYVVAHYSRHRL